MKRLFLIIPILFLFLVSSCTGSILLDPDQSRIATAVAGTQTAISWTPVPTPTYNPNIPNMINWLNNDLSTSSPLGWTLDAEYHVLNVSFPNAPDGVVFRVDVGCICMNSSRCCTPERTFVVVAEAMKRNSNTALAQVAGNMSRFMDRSHDCIMAGYAGISAGKYWWVSTWNTCHPGG
jgi:hypothetical protein